MPEIAKHSFLVWQMAGPLASWGRTAVGEKRLSDAEPTRSALVGLLAACAGIDRSDEDNLQALNSSLGFASAVLADNDQRTGPVQLRDYHTIQTTRPVGRKGRIPLSRSDELDNVGDTILSERFYFSGGVYLGCAWIRSKPLMSLDSLAQALKEPCFSPYLGRRACPLGIPFAPRVIDSEGCESAMVTYLSDGRLQEVLNGPVTAKRISWDLDAPGLRPRLDQQIRRRDDTASFRRRQYNERSENMMFVRQEQDFKVAVSTSISSIPSDEEMFDDIPE